MEMCGKMDTHAKPFTEQNTETLTKTNSKMCWMSFWETKDELVTSCLQLSALAAFSVCLFGG